MQEYQVTLTRFLDAYALASNPATRTGPVLEAKQACKVMLVNATRTLVDVIQAWPQMTDDKRRMLKITVREKAKPVARPGV